MERNAAEFTALQREFRHMELNRKSYADESYQLLRKQQATIGKLRAEAEALKQEVALETRRKTASAQDWAETSKQAEEVEKFEMLYEEEMKRMRELDAEIKTAQKRTIQQRKEMGGVNAARETQHMVQKQIKILENRLDQALVKFNQALAKNKSLRESIDDLRRERVVFDNIYRKLERELVEKKKQMANVIELSNLAYEQRDAAQMEIAAIEQANRKEQDDFESQMVELTRLLENELVVPAAGRQGSHRQLALTTGGATANSNSNGAREDRRRTNTSTTALIESQQQQQQQHARSKSIRPRPELLTKEKQELQQGEERVQNFEEAFNRIKTATGIASIDELVKIFVKNEDQNFSLFNYVNEQTNEIEKLEEQVQHLRDEEAKYTQESGADVNQHKLVLADLESQRKSVEAQADKFEAKALEYQGVLDDLKHVVASTFTKTGCQNHPQVKAAPDLADAVVTEANMLQYLAIIEDQCNTIIKDYVAVQQKQAKQAAALAETPDAAAAASPSSAIVPGMSKNDGGVAATVLGTGPTTPMGQDLIHVNPPKLEDYSSEDEDEDDGETRPLTRAELKAKTLNRMYRRVNRSNDAATTKPTGGSQRSQAQSSSPKKSLLK